MRKTYLDNLVESIINIRVLSRIFVLWIMITAISTALSISFVSNIPTMAAAGPVVKMQDIDTDINIEKQIDYGLAGLQTNSPAISAVEKDEDSADAKEDAELRVNQIILPERLIIDALDIDLPVSNPSTTKVSDLDKELLKSVVRYPGSGTLGEDGRNILIFGHSARIPTYRGFYRAFNDIETLKEGEVIVIKSVDKEYLYRVSNVKKASATDGKVDLNAKNNKLTLVTCDGFGKKSDRWVVESDFIGSFDVLD